MSDHVDIIAAIMATEKELSYEELNCILNEQSEPLWQLASVANIMSPSRPPLPFEGLETINLGDFEVSQNYV